MGVTSLACTASFIAMSAKAALGCKITMYMLMYRHKPMTLLEEATADAGHLNSSYDVHSGG